MPSSGRPGGGASYSRDYGPAWSPSRPRSTAPRRPAGSRTSTRSARVERARAARGRRLRRDRAGARVRHARLRLRGGRHPRRARARTWRRSGRAPTASRSSTRARRSRAPPSTGCCRGGALLRRRLRRRALPGAARRLRPRADLLPRQQQNRGRARVRDRERASATSSSTRSTSSSGSSGWRRGRAVMLRVTPGIRPDTHELHPTGQDDSKFGFGIDECRARSSGSRDGRLELARPPRPPRLPGLRPRALERLAEVLGAHGRLSAAEPRRRPGDRLHGRRAPPSIEDYVERVLRRRPDGVTSCASRAARSSATPG